MPQPHRSPRKYLSGHHPPELVLIDGGEHEPLPIRVAPFPDEWATSWLRRLAWRYDIAPNKFFDQLGYRRKIHTVQAITTRLKTNAHGLADHLMLSELERA